MNLLESDIFEELIAEKMGHINELKNQLPEEKNIDGVNFVDKSLFKRVLSDITDIYMDQQELNVVFGRGVYMRLESANQARSNEFIQTIDYRFLKILGELIDAGQIKIKTSPFVVKLSKDRLKTTYFKSLDEELHDLPLIQNIHDRGINCWGGWGGPVRSSFNDFELETTLTLMTQRMKQLNIDDYARDLNKVSEIIALNYRENVIATIDPIYLAKLVIDYDLENRVISDSPYLSRSDDGKLSILDDYSDYFEIVTNIDFGIFLKILEKMKAEHNGIKPKIRPVGGESSNE
jgi:hypothetical protein